MTTKTVSGKAVGLIVFLAIIMSLNILVQQLWAEEDISLPVNPLEGRKIFISKGCGTCHAVWGQGGAFGPDLVMISKGKSFLQLVGALWNHSPKMIEIMQEKGLTRPTFSPKEISLLMAYIYYLNYFDQPGNFAKGEKIFKEKSCVNCHSLAGKGGNVGPALDKYQPYMSAISIAQAMWNHGPKIAQKMAQHGISWPKFQGAEVGDLLAYIRGVGKAEEKGEQIYLLPGNPKNGEKLFTTKSCIQCHSLDGAGGKVGPDLSRKELHGSVSEIAGRMWNHGPNMWELMASRGIPIPELSSGDMADIIAYVYFISYLDKGGDANKGKDYFIRKGCASCHVIGGIGKRIGPDLSESEAITSPINLASSMWNHAPIMEKMLEEQNLPWPRFEGDEMRDLVEYIRSYKKEAKTKN